MSSLKGCDLTNDQFQPWHSDPFVQAAETGVELLYPYEDAIIGACVAPFEEVSDKYYQLSLDVVSTPPGCNLFILPHYRYYMDPETTPLPLACWWGTDWWARPLVITFRRGQHPAVFKKGEPFAQALVMEKQTCTLSLLDGEKDKAAAYIQQHADEYITRKWTTSTGAVQDNLYNVLANLQRDRKLPT